MGSREKKKEGLKGDEGKVEGQKKSSRGKSNSKGGGRRGGTQEEEGGEEGGAHTTPERSRAWALTDIARRPRSVGSVFHKSNVLVAIMDNSYLAVQIQRVPVVAKSCHAETLPRRSSLGPLLHRTNPQRRRPDRHPNELQL